MFFFKPNGFAFNFCEDFFMKLILFFSVFIFSFSFFAQAEKKSAQEISASEEDIADNEAAANEENVSEKKSIEENSEKGISADENFGNENSARQNSNEENSDDEKKSLEEKYLVFKTSSQEIRMLETNSDIFSASSSAQKNRALTSIADGELQRRFYDEDFRLSKIEYWQIAATSAQSKMRRRLDYEFDADGKISALRENDFDAQTSSVTFFNADGKIRSSRKNKLLDGKLDSFEIFTYEYDGEGRVLEERRQIFKVQGEKQRRVLSQRGVNKYSGEKLIETSFYENSVLRIRTVYTDSENYVQTTYFDGGLAVRDFYENGQKISSAFSNEKRSGSN